MAEGRYWAGCWGHSASPVLVPQGQVLGPLKGREGGAGRHEWVVHCIARAPAAMAVASLSGPWSDPEANPALQRDTSDMVTGPARQSLQDSKLKALLTRTATAFPFCYFQPSLCILIIFVGRGKGYFFFMPLIGTKLCNVYGMPLFTCMGGKGRLCSQTRPLELTGASWPLAWSKPLFHPFYKGGG